MTVTPELPVCGIVTIDVNPCLLLVLKDTLMTNLKSLSFFLVLGGSVFVKVPDCDWALPMVSSTFASRRAVIATGL